MNWVLILTHVAAMYAAIGTWCGYAWCRRDGDSVAVSVLVGVPIGMLLWPLAYGQDDSVVSPVPMKKGEFTKAALEEQKRMNRELVRERGRVMMIEMSANHRKEMAALAERRRIAEEMQ